MKRKNKISLLSSILILFSEATQYKVLLSLTLYLFLTKDNIAFNQESLLNPKYKRYIS